MTSATQDYFRYFQVGSRDRQWGLYTTGAGRVLHRTPAMDFSRHPEPHYSTSIWDKGGSLPEYQAVFITQGKGEFESEASGKRAVSAGDVFLVFPGVWHRYRPTQGDLWNQYWVGFNGDYADRLVREGFFSRQEPVLTAGLDEVLFQSYLRLLDRINSEPLVTQPLVAANVMEILGAVQRAMQRQVGGRRGEALVSQAILFLQQRLDQPADEIEQLAESAGVSYSRFRHIFKEQTGLSPGQYHLQMRLSRAKEMLRSSPLAVKQIAASLGFVDQYHFSKIFRKHAGMSPRQWRGPVTKKVGR